MGDHTRFVLVLIDILVSLYVGHLLQRWGMAREWVRLLIRCNVVGICSLLALFSFWSLRVAPELLWMPLSILPICFLSLPLYWLWERRRFTDPRDQGSYVITMMLGNIGTLAGLCAYSLYGETGFAYIQLIAVPQVLVVVLFVFPLAHRYYEAWATGGQTSRHGVRLREALLTWNQLPVVCVAAGLLLGAFGVPRPEAAAPIFTALIHISAWMGMISVGYDLHLAGVRRYALRLWPLFPVKFLYLPLLLFAMTRLITQDPVILWCVVLAAAAPTAIFAVTSAQLYRLNVDMAEAAFLTTTAAFLFIIYPIIYVCASQT